MPGRDVDIWAVDVRIEFDWKASLDDFRVWGMVECLRRKQSRCHQEKPVRTSNFELPDMDADSLDHDVHMSVCGSINRHFDLILFLQLNCSRESFHA